MSKAIQIGLDILKVAGILLAAAILVFALLAVESGRAPDCVRCARNY